MRQLASRIFLAHGLLAVACATAIDAPLLENASGTNSGGSRAGAGGSSSSAGSTTSHGGGGKTNGGSPSAFGGTASGGGKAGSSSSGGSAGSSSGGGGVSNGGAAGSSGGNASAGSGGSESGGNAGSTIGGSGAAGNPPSAACESIPDWTSKTYAIGDTVASTCSGAFAHGCPAGQSHEFECNPMAGVAALPWCKDRQPGSGNGWWEAWVDKGQCE